MNKTKLIYQISTAIICSVMVYSVVNFNLKIPFAPPEGSFAHLGLPDYFRIELSIAKSLGILALLLPRIPYKLREFAYFGFGITLISASFAHFSSGDGPLFVVDPLIFLGILSVSYVACVRLHRDYLSHVRGTTNAEKQISRKPGFSVSGPLEQVSTNPSR
jgi:hypothetical protein